MMHTMFRRTLLATALLVPLAALAMEIQPADFYDDVRNASQVPGINLLTREDVVKGYGNRIFGPNRLVNRAEFLKMAIETAPAGRVELLDNDNAGFTDVPMDAWFTKYVGAAQEASIVNGYPDGTFHPEQPVQYDEALKMLTLLFDYDIPQLIDGDWGESYLYAAHQRGVDLPIVIRFDTQLTRGNAVRLAAAFLAESEGLLDELRLAESGHYISSSPSSSSSSSSSSVSSISSLSSSSSSVGMFTLPAVSHFLVVGKTSDAIASGVVRRNGETAQVSIVQVKLFQEVRSIEKLELVTSDGQLVATLLRRTTTDIPDYKQTFDAQVAAGSRYTLSADTDVTLVLRAVIRSTNNAGFSDELLQVRSISVTTTGDQSNQSVNVPLAGPFPKHQTAFGRIMKVARQSEEQRSIQRGTGMLLTSLSVSGSVISGKSLAVTSLTFAVQRTGALTLANAMLKNRATNAFVLCTFNEQAMTISCPGLGTGVGSLDSQIPLILDLTADISYPAGSTDVSLQADLASAGSPASFGSVEWTDGTGSFKWVESTESPLVRGTRLQ